MPVRISNSTIGQAVALAALIGICVGMQPVRPAQALRVATTTPADESLYVAPIRPAEPAALLPVEQAPIAVAPAPVTPSAYPATVHLWRSLRPALRAEAQVLMQCRADAAACPPAAKNFLDIIEAARAQSGRARLGHINRAVNLAIRFTSDVAQYGVRDVWATPLMTFASGRGDCEDYAIAKYVALRATGMAAADLRLMIMHNARSNEEHAVVAARLGGEWLMLDNRRMAMLTETQASDLTLLVALGDDDEAPASVAAAPALPADGRTDIALAGQPPSAYAD